jgi:hypothetical protein
MDSPDTSEKIGGSSQAVILNVKKRPWSVTLLVLLVLLITILNLIRIVLSIKDWGFLSTYSTISPLYLALTGLVWSVAGGFLMWGLWKAKPWAPRLMQAFGLTYALYYWLDQIFLKDHPLSETKGIVQAVIPTNWQFAAIVTALALVFMEWVMNRKKVKEYFAQLPVDD